MKGGLNAFYAGITGNGNVGSGDTDSMVVRSLVGNTPTNVFAIAVTTNGGNAAGTGGARIGDIRMHQYPSSRNDSAVTTANYLSTDQNGVLRSKPYIEPLVHHHRITTGDAPVISTFNGQTYTVSQGWVPIIAGVYMGYTSGANSAGVPHGLNFRVNGAGNWELAGDHFGLLETWKVDLVFQKFLPSQVLRFGTFN